MISRWSLRVALLAATIPTAVSAQNAQSISFSFDHAIQFLDTILAPTETAQLGSTNNGPAVSFQAIYKNSFDPSGAKNGSGTFTITPPTSSFTGVLKQLSDQIFFVLDESLTIQFSAKSGGPAGTPVSGVNERINQAGVPIDNCNFTTTGLRTHTALSVTPPAQRDENGWRIPVSAFN